jgi:hypothetical protein
MIMNTTEEAYNELAKAAHDFTRGRPWDIAVCQCQIYHKMASSSVWLVKDEAVVNQGLGWPTSGIDQCGAALFLRDNLLATTGDRIWGLTFTLYPDGKFNIEYDYTKPEGYVETEEVVEVNPVELPNMAKGL